ncbi:hypothetical protein [Rhizobium sp. BK251]|uniref:hypothetical protein n=1 Tax=Rhizobium sp. BK251 TaxID=2512125 RepID=UPI00104580F5|nr:hypothetical protein [Rhizobium sp. BK251]TCL65136.1 hypothetical protein EV286_11331 [Rhizobium sp. BK251]
MSRYTISALGGLIAAAVVAVSPALASNDGDYYQGASRDSYQRYSNTQRYQAPRRTRTYVDRMPVNSIFGSHKNVRNGGEGEYFQGPNRN